MEQQPDSPLTPTQEVVCQASLEAYHRINSLCRYPKADEPLSTESNCWKAGFEPIGPHRKLIANLRFVGDISKFSDGLDDLMEHAGVIECTTANTIVQIFCLRALLGQDKFQEHVRNIFEKCEQHGKPELFFYTLPKHFWTVSADSIAAPGRLLAIANIPEYATFKPEGMASGENVVCVGQDSYVGFGPLFAAGAMPLETIEENLRQDFLSDALIEPEQALKHSARAKIYRNKEIYKRVREKNQSKVTVEFDARKVEHFLMTGKY
jgi:hypothetical protein